MAIVEDEVRNDSEEENEIEVVVEEDEADQDSDDSDGDDDDDDLLEMKVTELEGRIADDPYQYHDHIDLIQALWRLSELDRWRAAFERLQQWTVLQAEHWLLRLQTEVTLAHSAEAQEHIAELFQQAALDCYSIPILSEWCSWAITAGDAVATRAHLDDVVKRAGADPLSGKMFFDAKYEFEKSQLEAMSASDPSYDEQRDRVLWCLEEAASRPLLRSEETLPQLTDLAAGVKDDKYFDKIKKQHEVAADYLQKITPFENKLLTLECITSKIAVYQEYIDAVKDLSRDDKYAECDSNGILKVLYDRATTECVSCAEAPSLLVEFARHARAHSSRATYGRVLAACTRRCPRRATFWTRSMELAEREGKPFDEVKSIFETALSKGMESYKEAQALWMGYLEYIRRKTAFDNADDVERLRRTFRLAWDSLAETWGEEANDCEVPVFWARLEYRRMRDARRGKDIYEEIFKYGTNKTLTKYWEAFIALETSREPPLSENKTRDLYRRALKFVTDYPATVGRLWADYERDYGQADTLRDCLEAQEEKIKEWKASYQAMKDKMMGNKNKGKQILNKKPKFDKKKMEADKPKRGKRKADESSEGSEVKKKKDIDMKVDKSDKAGDGGAGVKRSHDEDGSQSGEHKRQRTDSSEDSRLIGREAATLFVSNLEFKVDEQSLRDELSKYGDIVSLRVKSGVKTFGGSICFCQYKTTESVDEALKHDRSPLQGRPMFFSRYTAKKTKPSFKYPTTVEKNKLFVRNLPYSHCTKEALEEVFDKYGKLKDVRQVTFKDGKPKGLAYIEYEDESSAAVALEKTNGLLVGDRNIEVALSAPPPRKEPAPTLGLPKRDATGGMRRTQLSSMIPSVLLKPSTSKEANGDSSGPAKDPEKRPLTNTDFRSMLLNK